MVNNKVEKRALSRLFFCIIAFVKALLPAFTPNKERIVITKYVALFS
jgi:hypothetical protein